MTNSDQIITRADAIASIITKHREAGQSIVLTQGTFDMVHIGHARYCHKAKSYGDVLVVGVDADDKVKFRKGADRPVVPEDERMEMLTYLKPVDYVFLKKLKASKYSLIKLLKPDVLVATDQTYTDTQLKELKKWCGKVVVLKPMATTSTSAKIRRMQIGIARRMGDELSERLMTTIHSFFDELKKK